MSIKTSGPAKKSLAEPPSSRHTPRLVRLAEAGSRYGLSRSALYALEKSGALKFRRLVLPGKNRGVAYIDTAELESLIR